MQTETEIETSAVIQKTRELCQAILDQPEVRDMRRRIDTFIADDATRTHYDALLAKGQSLQEKQHSGQPLEDSEIAEFEQSRETFLNNPIARGFLDAQEEMQKLKLSVTQYVNKTFELGHVPEENELESGSGGSCGSGCGCH